MVLWRPSFKLSTKLSTLSGDNGVNYFYFLLNNNCPANIDTFKYYNTDTKQMYESFSIKKKLILKCRLFKTDLTSRVSV